MPEINKHKLSEARKRARYEGWEQWIRPGPQDELALASGHFFNPTAAEYVRDFFSRMLRHTKGPLKGQPFHLADFQYRDIIAPLYGWMKPQEVGMPARRRFSHAFVTMGKKNGKTGLAAGLALLHLVGFQESRAVIRSAATTRKQAGYIYEEASAMIRENPELLRIIGKAPAGGRTRANLPYHKICIENTKTINYRAKHCNYQALSADADAADGLNCNLVIYDELHHWVNRRSKLLYATLSRSGRSIPNRLHLITTTAGDSKQSLAYSEYQLSKKVLAGEVQLDHYFAFIAEAPADADIASPETWKMANPGMGVCFDQESINEDYLQSVISPEKLLEFRRFTCNQWVAGSSKWLPWGAWDEGQEGSFHDLAEKLKGRLCIGALDVGLVNDLTAFVLLFPPEQEGEKYVVLSWFWLPQDTVEKLEKEHDVNYRAWEREGFIELTEGNFVDQKVVCQRIRDLAKAYQIREIGYDTKYAELLAQQLQDDDGIHMVPVGMEPSCLNEGSRMFEGLVLDRKINAGHHPILSWMASNVCVRKDSQDRIAPTKESKDSPEKIDGITATVIAFTCLKDNPDLSPQESVYEKDDAGVLWL